MPLELSLRRLGRFLAWKLFPLADIRLTLKSGVTFPIADRSELAMFRELAVWRVYDQFLDALPAPRTVLDLGCHCGYFPLLIHHRARLRNVDMHAARFVLVDANFRLVQRAREVICQNQLPGEFVFISGLIGPKGQRVPFYVRRHSASSSLFKRSARARAVHLDALDLTAIMDQHLGGPVDLIKCDIEGGELYLITDWPDVVRRTRALLIEWHDFAMGWEDLTSGLGAIGFNLVAAETQGNFRVALFTPLNSSRAETCRV